MVGKSRGVKANRVSLQKAREVVAQLRAAKAEANAQAVATVTEAEGQADAGAGEAVEVEVEVEVEVQAGLQHREQQLAENLRLHALQQQLHDLMRGELQRKEQQLADSHAQQHAALLRWEQQLNEQQQQLQQQVTEQQQQLQQQQADLSRREQDLTEGQQQLQQQHADLSRREQDLTERQQQLQQQHADLHSKEQQLIEQCQLTEQQARIQTLQQQLHRLQRQEEARRGAEVQREVFNNTPAATCWMAFLGELCEHYTPAKERALQPAAQTSPTRIAAQRMHSAAPTVLLSTSNRFATLPVADDKEQQLPCHAQDTSASHRQRGHIMFRRYLVLDDARQATVCSMPEADVERMHKDVKGCRAMHRMVFTPDGDQPQWTMAACACSTYMSVPCLPCMKPDTTTPLEPMPMFQDTVKEVREDEECYALLMLYHSDLLHDEMSSSAAAQMLVAVYDICADVDFTQLHRCR
ncbi:hypothetical protein QJQ45_009530 [Haematococcus lacustris]|nr:hypothetical protein QJQ45_009530 [Haematococcus lacustris]